MKYILVSFMILAHTLVYANVNQYEMNLIQSVIPGSKILDAEKSPIDGLYLVMLENKKFLYIYPFKHIIFFGEIMSSKGQNISVALKDKLIKDNSSNSDLLKEIQSKKDVIKSMKEIAIKVVYGKGNSKYVLYTFTDPDCPFCQKLEKEFSRSNIEVNYLFTPIERLHPLAATKAKQLISNTQDMPRLLNKIREGDTLNVKENSESKIILEKMKKIAKMFNFESTPLSIVIDKRTDTVVDFIQGADMKKIKQYIKGEKDEK